jgi:hypothetical protein
MRKAASRQRSVPSPATTPGDGYLAVAAFWVLRALGVPVPG